MGLVDDNVFPKLIYGMQTTNPAAPTDSSWKTFAKADGVYARSSNTVVGPFGGTGNYSGVSWSSGTSMPGSPATNQRITRTDLGLDFFYDGTRWRSVQIFHDIGHNDFAGAASANGTAGRWAIPGGLTYTDIWVIAVRSQTYHSGAPVSSNYWNGDVLKGTAAEVETSLGTFNTSSDTSVNWTNHTLTVGALLTSSSNNHIRVALTKTGSPGNLNIEVAVMYQLVST